MVRADLPVYALVKHKHNPCLNANRGKMLCSQSCHLSIMNFLTPNFFMQMFNVSLMCRQSTRLFHQKLWYELIGMHMHYLCINKIHKELQRAMTLIELAPSPYFSIINVYLISMCLQGLMKFHHCLWKILRENQNIAD